MLPKAISKLSKTLTAIPTIGPKSADKLALWFSSHGLAYSQELGKVLSELSSKVGICNECGYFTEGDSALCCFCDDESRNQTHLCLVEQNIDIIDIEESGAFDGRYFVLGGIISPLEGVTISDLPFDRLKQKIIDQNIKELTIAFGATTEADVTVMYIKDFLSDTDVVVSVLGRGIAVGTQIHYAGKKSLAEAFRIREKLD